MMGVIAIDAENVRLFEDLEGVIREYELTPTEATGLRRTLQFRYLDDEHAAHDVNPVVEIGAHPVGALMANLMSWLWPPLRQANEAAMQGTQVSFTTANYGLVQFAIVSVPVGLLAVAVAAFAPWAR